MSKKAETLARLEAEIAAIRAQLDRIEARLSQMPVGSAPTFPKDRLTRS